MRISTFFYTIKQGMVNIWKNKMFSLASIATMTACIFLFGLFYMIVMNFQSMVKMQKQAWRSRCCLTMGFPSKDRGDRRADRGARRGVPL